jgi:magnesium transporter
MTIQIITHGKLTWVNIEHPTAADIEYLRERYDFHPLDYEDVLSKIQRPKIDEYEDYLFIVMHFPVFDKSKRVTTPSEVDIFIGAGYLVTIHDGRLKPLLDFFAACEGDEVTRKRYMGKSTGHLLYQVLDRLVDYCFPILDRVVDNIEEIEDQAFSEDVREMVREISIVRRDLIALRRIIKPQIPVIANLEHRDRDFLHEDLDVYFGDVADAFNRIWDTLEDYKEVVEGLSDTVDTLTSYRINEVMRVLTTISVILLPLSLLSGIYGMNIDLPLDEDPWAWIIILGFMGFIVLGMLGYFRRKHWL